MYYGINGNPNYSKKLRFSVGDLVVPSWSLQADLETGFRGVGNVVRIVEDLGDGDYGVIDRNCLYHSFYREWTGDRLSLAKREAEKQVFQVGDKVTSVDGLAWDIDGDIVSITDIFVVAEVQENYVIPAYRVFNEYSPDQELWVTGRDLERAEWWQVLEPEHKVMFVADNGSHKAGDIVTGCSPWDMFPSNCAGAPIIRTDDSNSSVTEFLSPEEIEPVIEGSSVPHNWWKSLKPGDSVVTSDKAYLFREGSALEVEEINPDDRVFPIRANGYWHRPFEVEPPSAASDFCY